MMPARLVLAVSPDPEETVLVITTLTSTSILTSLPEPESILENSSARSLGSDEAIEDGTARVKTL
jgi:hypothetical protein